MRAHRHPAACSAQPRAPASRPGLRVFLGHHRAGRGGGSFLEPPAACCGEVMTDHRGERDAGKAMTPQDITPVLTLATTQGRSRIACCGGRWGAGRGLGTPLWFLLAGGCGPPVPHSPLLSPPHPTPPHPTATPAGAGGAAGGLDQAEVDLLFGGAMPKAEIQADIFLKVEPRQRVLGGGGGPGGGLRRRSRQTSFSRWSPGRGWGGGVQGTGPGLCRGNYAAPPLPEHTHTPGWVRDGLVSGVATTPPLPLPERRQTL